MDVIQVAAWRVSPQYAQLSSEDLAAAVTAHVAYRQMTATAFFAMVVASGGSAADLGTIEAGWVERAERALASGERLGVEATFAVLAGRLSQPTQMAVQAVLAASALRQIDLVAAELGVTAPETVTTEAIDAALGRE